MASDSDTEKVFDVTGCDVEHVLEHCPQRYSWDCGVACVAMLLDPGQRKQFLQRYDEVCLEEGFGQSTWTIDLCYLLKRFGIAHSLYTTMPGVNEAYRRHGYYNRIIDLDRERVQRRFAEASVRGVLVFARRLSLGALVRHVARAGPALLLVDGARLACDRCGPGALARELSRLFGAGYRGHYVVLVGVRGGRLVYRDPARAHAGAAPCAARPARVQRARTAAGTDEDVVLIHRAYS